MMELGLIWMLIFWGGLITLAVWLIGLLFPAAQEQHKDDDRPLSAGEILKTRYAHGELTTQEYHEILKTIQQEGFMSRKRHSKRRKKSPPKRQLPWLWLVAGGAFLLVIGGLGMVWASSNARPAVAPEVTGAPRLIVDQTVIDEGYIKLDNTVRTTFRLRNVGDQPLYIMGEPQVELVEGC